MTTPPVDVKPSRKSLRRERLQADLGGGVTNPRAGFAYATSVVGLRGSTRNSTTMFNRAVRGIAMLVQLAIIMHRPSDSWPASGARRESVCEPW